jgi:TPR repeat protein
MGSYKSGSWACALGGGLVLLGCSAATLAADLVSGLSAWRTGQPAQAVGAWRPLAEAGDVQAQLFLAYAYRKGQGVKADDVTASHWYRKAAEQGLADAQYELGLMYELGHGVARDPDEAEYWYGLAVDQGYCPGELSAGGLLGD